MIIIIIFPGEASPSRPSRWRICFQCWRSWSPWCWRRTPRGPWNQSAWLIRSAPTLYYAWAMQILVFISQDLYHIYIYLYHLYHSHGRCIKTTGLTVVIEVPVISSVISPLAPGPSIVQQLQQHVEDVRMSFFHLAETICWSRWNGTCFDPLWTNEENMEFQICLVILHFFRLRNRRRNPIIGYHLQ